MGSPPADLSFLYIEEYIYFLHAFSMPLWTVTLPGPAQSFPGTWSVPPGAEAVPDLGLSPFLSWGSKTAHTVQGMQIYTAAW